MRLMSKDYKQAMAKPIREQGHIQIGLGAICLEAQGSADARDNEFTYWSNTQTLFTNKEDYTEYATLEENFMKADGELLFMPKEDSITPINNVGIATENLLGTFKVEFADRYAIKGLTIDFGTFYPTSFKVTNDEGVDITYANDSEIFTCTDVIGTTKYILITALEMVNGVGRLRIKNMLMGVGLTFGNSDVKSANWSDFVSAISEECPKQTFSATILDIDNKYNVDSTDSFINFLEIGQDVTIAYGMTLDNGNTEWLQVGRLKLKSWCSKVGEFNFKAQDFFADKKDKYVGGNTVHSRTAYQEVETILQDMGLSSDDYVIDYYLDGITFTAPTPQKKHKEVLQLIANATRCIFYQNYDGRIYVVGNFANVIEPDDMTVETNGVTAWSNPHNILTGTNYVYADMTQNFFRADASQFFMSDNGLYLDTGYVSSVIADANGDFASNPILTIKLEAGYTFYGFLLNFDGNAPKEVVMRTYFNDAPVQTSTFTDLESENYMYYEFERFDTIEFEFTKGEPNNRVLVNKFSLGDYNDYKLVNRDIFDTGIYGERDDVIKQIAVKIYSYDSQTGKVVDDDVYYTEVLNSVGDCLEVKNPYITTEQMAKDLAEWLKNYYINNVVYDVSYRGEPKLNASDIIHVDNDILNNLQVAIEEHKLKFNGAFSGDLTLRRALKTQELT